MISRNQGSILEPFLWKGKKEPQEPIKPSRNESRLWHIHSAPSLHILDEDNLRREKPPSHGPPGPLAKDKGPSTLVKALIGLASYLIVGVFIFSFLGDDLGGESTTTVVDALYFTIVTLTSVGYGDITPNSTSAKLFTCVFVFIGFGLIGVLVSGAANYLVEKQERILVQKVYNKYRWQADKVSIGDDGVVTAQWKAIIAGVIVLVLFVLGVLVLHYLEHMSFINAFYCVCVTVTTLGYGDQSFNTKAGRIFATFWILLSTVCVAQFFLYLAEVRTEERQHEIAHWALCRHTTPSDLEAADLDGNGVVSKAEFVLYKLKECGKIEQSDVVDFLKEFDALDYDHSGTLCHSDVLLSQQSADSEQSAPAA
ncbi:unnamed protein product [Sphagnum troendelagicum]